MSGAADGREAVIFKIRKALGTYDSGGAPGRGCRAPRHARRRRWCRSAPSSERERAAAAVPQLPRGPVGDRDRGGERGGGPGRDRAASCARPTCRCGCASATTPISTRCAWESEPALERSRGPAAGDDEVGLEPRGGRRRRDGHAGAGVGRRQSGDAELPARDAHRRRRGQGPGRRLRGRVGEDPRPLRQAAPCRARSTSSPAPPAPPTSAGNW